jgi:hypothetical protein
MRSPQPKQALEQNCHADASSQLAVTPRPGPPERELSQALGVVPQRRLKSAVSEANALRPLCGSTHQLPGLAARPSRRTLFVMEALELRELARDRRRERCLPMLPLGRRVI